MINYCPNEIFNEEFQKLLTTNHKNNIKKKNDDLLRTLLRTI